MKNIGILELHFHIKYLHTTMKISKLKETKVTVFTTKKIYERIKTYLDNQKDYEIILKNENESIKDFLKRVEKICNDRIDLLFVNTIQLTTIRLLPYTKFRPNTKMILTIHMLNHWLKEKITLNLKHLPRSIDASFCIFLIHRYILPKYNAISVIYSPLKDFIKNNTSYKKPVFTIPFNFFENKKTSKKDDKINFVIPGLIEPYRRNYYQALDVFEEIFEKYNEKIQLMLLGKPVGKDGNNIIEKCKNLQKKGYNISFSDRFIPEEEYDKKMTQSTIIFSPLNVETKRNTGIKEIYGQTEGSALPFEAIQYMKPLILPNEFNIVENIKSSTISYDNKDDLKEKIINLINDNNKLEKIKKEAEKNSKNYSLQKLQKYFKENILNQLDSL